MRWKRTTPRTIPAKWYKERKHLWRKVIRTSICEEKQTYIAKLGPHVSCISSLPSWRKTSSTYLVPSHRDGCLGCKAKIFGLHLEGHRPFAHVLSSFVCSHSYISSDKHEYGSWLWIHSQGSRPYWRGQRAVPASKSIKLLQIGLHSGQFHCSVKEFPGSTPAICAIAPGRVNLIGGHTDYNAGFVLPMALPMVTVVVGRKREDPGSNRCSIATTFSVRDGEPKRVDFDSVSLEYEGESVPKWGNYVKGVVACFHQQPLDGMGFEAAIATSVPIGKCIHVLGIWDDNKKREPCRVRHEEREITSCIVRMHASSLDWAIFFWTCTRLVSCLCSEFFWTGGYNTEKLQLESSEKFIMSKSTIWRT